MSYLVPEFDIDEFCTSSPTPSQRSRHKNILDDEVKELVWHNGQVSVQNQSPRLCRTPTPLHHMPPSRRTEQPPLPQPENASNAHLFMEEDEMAAWFHYPLDDDTSFDQHITDFLYQPPPSSSTYTLPPPANLRLPPTPPPRPPAHSPAVRVNFPQFGQLRARVPKSRQSAANSTNIEPRESTIVDSSDTLKSSIQPVSSSKIKFSDGESINDRGAMAGTWTAGASGGSMSLSIDAETYWCSGSDGSATATADPVAQTPSDDRKRKGMESTNTFTTDDHSKDYHIDQSYHAKKFCRGTSGKRSRATEVHNLSERKRRDRINEKMKALQELIPRCTKTDKASMLDYAIEHMKSLQMQLQMLSMGYYGMVPMMLPGVQQYMPGGMGMEMGMNRPTVPFPVQTPRASSFMGPRFQFPGFQMPPIPAFHPARAQTNQMESFVNLNRPSDANVYQHYLGAHQMPLQPVSENPPPISTPRTSEARASKEAAD